MIPGLIYLWMAFTFVLGACVGSWLNVCIYRIPYEKSLLWPGSHCGNCFQAIRCYDNIPLVSYWVLRGRCRSCGAKYSIRYFCIELLTGLLFAGVFYLDAVVNILGIPALEYQRGFSVTGVPPARIWLLWLGHCTLVSLLIVAAFCDFDHLEIPLSVTLFGTIVGLLLSVCFPWPWPSSPMDLRSSRLQIPFQDPVPLLGFHPWPLWRLDELPSWLAAGSWQLGLATGLAGVLAGMIMLRAVRFLFGLGRGVEGLGMGDADLMMMAGAFVGWQPILIAFFVSVFPALLLGVLQVIFRGNQMIPFGPALAVGVLVTLFGWRWIGEYAKPLFFNSTMLLVLAGAGAVSLLAISFLLRLTRGSMEVAEEPQPAAVEEKKP